ncbi:MAG: hypothetical protein C0179_01555 [Fervidicoccus sp.]|nr:MAG: hypothetical protein C0179_01555 [Fervidicoccus sp.]
MRYFKELDKESRVMYRISIDHVERNKILAMLVDKVFCEDFSSFPTRCRHFAWRYEDRGSIEVEFGVAPSASPELIDRPLYFVLIVSEKLAEPWFSDFAELGRTIETEGVRNTVNRLSNSLRQIAVLSLERLKSDSVSSFSQKLHGVYVRKDERGEMIYRIDASRYEEKAEIWIYHSSGKLETPFVHALIRLSPSLQILSRCSPREAVDIIVQAVIDELLSSMNR